MSTFDIAVIPLLKNEGGFVNDPNDPGGATNRGISLRWLRGISLADGDFNNDGVIDIKDIKLIDDEKASVLYKKYWWDAHKYGLINDQSIATKILDFSVNMGPSQGHKLIQRACWAANGYKSLDDDGVLGAISIACINKSTPQVILAALKSEAAGFYRSLIASKAAMEEYKNGWLKRAYQ